MSKPTPHLVHVARNSQTPASRAHTQFNNLIKKIDKHKQALRAWMETESILHNKLTTDFLPQHAKVGDLKADLARLLDRAHADTRFKKRDRDKLAHLITTLAGELLTDFGRDDLKPLYDAYNAVDFDTEQQALNEQHTQFMRNIMEAQFGMKLDEDLDLTSPEQLAEELARKLFGQAEVSEEGMREAEARRPPRKKTAKQLEKEARQEAEAKSVSQSIQAIYRKLATALHPDREPDEAERARKTELMQAVNVAYEKRDLLQLLELQLTLEQIDPDHLLSMTEDRIKHYNKILREQAVELKDELDMIEDRIRLELHMPPYARLSPADVIHYLNRDIAQVKAQAASLKHDLEVLKDFDVLKAWIKDYRIPRRPRLDERMTDFDLPPMF